MDTLGDRSLVHCREVANVYTRGGEERDRSLVHGREVVSTCIVHVGYNQSIGGWSSLSILQRFSSSQNLHYQKFAIFS